MAAGFFLYMHRDEANSMFMMENVPTTTISSSLDPRWIQKSRPQFRAEKGSITHHGGNGLIG